MSQTEWQVYKFCGPDYAITRPRKLVGIFDNERVADAWVERQTDPELYEVEEVEVDQ